MRRKHLLPSVLCLVIANSCPAQEEITSNDVAAEPDHKIIVVVSPPSTFKSNLNGAAFFFGAAGQMAKGSSLQGQLQLTDPSIAVGSGMAPYLETLFESNQNTPYSLHLNTNTWGLWDAAGDHAKILYASAIIKLSLRDSSGKVIAKDVCNTGVALKDELFVDPKSVSITDRPKVESAFNKVSMTCVELFKSRMKA